MKTILLSVLLIVSFWFDGKCQVKKANNLSKNKTKNQSAANILRYIVGIEPMKCLDTTIDNKEIILGIANQSNDVMFPKIAYYKLSKFANVWRVENTRILFQDSFYYFQLFDEIELTSLKNKPYIYFVYSSELIQKMTEPMAYIHFSLMSLDNLEIKSLDYEKSTSFINIDSFSSDSQILNFLEKKASLSESIYRPTTEDLDINNPKNYSLKWKSDNPNINTWSAGVLDNNESQIKTTYYEKNIFRIGLASVSDSSENNKYKIITQWRGDVLGYNKITKQYFPIWCEDCAYGIGGCDKRISFVNGNASTLQIVYYEDGANDFKRYINLLDMTFK